MFFYFRRPLIINKGLYILEAEWLTSLNKKGVFMMTNNSNKFVYLAATLYAFITGLSFLFTKIALSMADPLDILAHRFTAAFLSVLILVLFKLVKLDYSMARIKKALPLAIFYPIMFFAFQTFGLQYATSSEAGILLAASPVFTLILATFFLKEETNILQKISVIISVIGVIYITLMKSSSFELNNAKGVTLLLLSALSISGYSVLGRVLTRDYSSIELSFIMSLGGFVFFNLISIANHLHKGTMSSFLLPLKNIQFILAIIYLGVLSFLVTSFSINYILSKIEASKMSVFTNLGTVISIVAGLVFLKEDIFYYHIIGSILIVGGVIGTNFLDRVEI